MNLIGLLDRPSAGTIHLAGRDVTRLSHAAAAQLRNETIGFVFQSFQLLSRLSAWENVALPLLYRGISKADRRLPALAMLERVGLSDRALHKPEALSGGQRQRVAIARALVGAPRLVLADEPTGSLDSETAVEIMALFRAFNRASGVTVIMVTHDTTLAAHCDRQITMLDGRIINDSFARV
jgi:putative ABC transport system ATP-binding protein